MAELILSALFKVLFQKMGDEALKKLARSKGIHRELKKLNNSLIQIKALLHDASRKEISDEAVKEWLNGLRHVAYYIDDILDDLATEGSYRELSEELGATMSKVRKLIPTSWTNFSLSRRMHGKFCDIATKLQELMETKNNLGLSVITYEKPKVKSYESCLVDSSCIVGREGDKKALLQKLLGDKDESCDQNFSIVPIVGMGGVGKTTLARLLYDEKEVKDHFELRAWVCVTDDFSISEISKVIYQSMTGENKEFADLNLLQEALKEKLTNKLFLIVLDDIWSESYDDWDKLVGPFLPGAPGSRIIMTTRKEQLLKKLGHAHVDPLQSLSQEDALSLFAQHALGMDNFDSYPTLRPHGEGFVKKCDCLPLALRTLGRLLRTKTDEEERKGLLNSQIWRLGEKDEIVPALRLSYNDLSASLKQLFAYCSLFPKDYVFDKEELILLWMAEGFLYQSTTSKSMERLGNEYFEELLSRSFFQHAPNDNTLFVMHDLLNDLATSLAGEFFSLSENEKKNEFRKGALEKYRHMSFVCERYMIEERFKAFKGAKNLRTFLALSFESNKSWQEFHLSNKVLADLLHKQPLLRVLSLSHITISVVPESIGGLKHLRYLNLSQTRIKCLPDNVCNLINLQTLILFGCRSLKELPNNFIKLKNLRHIDIGNIPLLKKMPVGIVELKNLQTLSKIIIKGENGFSIANLTDLKDLQGKVSIMGLDKVQSPIHRPEENLSLKRVTDLEVEWSDVFNRSRNDTLEKEVLNVLKPHNDHLKKLKIVSYGGIEFPNWVGDSSFLFLAHISIHGCKTCTSLPSLGQLPSLKELLIQGMDKVKVVGLELLGTGLAFHSLKILSFKDMCGWEVWSVNSVAVGRAFPCLQELLLANCPNLVEVSLEALPSLRVLWITRCGHHVLRSLVHVASSVTALNINSILGLNDQLWEGIIEYLGAVKELVIEHCNELQYLWESDEEASKFLVNLGILQLFSCEDLVSLGEKEEDHCGHNLTSLRILELLYCNKLKCCRCPNNIEGLRIYRCDSITSVSFPTGGQKLKSVFIENCPKLSEKNLGGGQNTRVLFNSSMQMLESVSISCWPNLKSINELSYFIHLTGLVITECQNMDSFPHYELPNLTMLKHLTIENCRSMDASFPCGLWPPKLCFLRIGG